MIESGVVSSGSDKLCDVGLADTTHDGIFAAFDLLMVHFPLEFGVASFGIEFAYTKGITCCPQCRLRVLRFTKLAFELLDAFSGVTTLSFLDALGVF